MCYNSSKDGENMDILCRDYKEEDLDYLVEHVDYANDGTVGKQIRTIFKDKCKYER